AEVWGEIRDGNIATDDGHPVRLDAIGVGPAADGRGAEASKKPPPGDPNHAHTPSHHGDSNRRFAGGSRLKPDQATEMSFGGRAPLRLGERRDRGPLQRPVPLPFSLVL